jgi:hypothetical protein
MHGFRTTGSIPPQVRLLEIKGKDVDTIPAALAAGIFVKQACSGLRYAVDVLVLDFARLSDEVNHRWVTSQCPRRRLSTDEKDRQTRFLSAE